MSDESTTRLFPLDMSYVEDSDGAAFQNLYELAFTTETYDKMMKLGLVCRKCLPPKGSGQSERLLRTYIATRDSKAANLRRHTEKLHTLTESYPAATQEVNARFSSSPDQSEATIRDIATSLERELKSTIEDIRNVARVRDGVFEQIWHAYKAWSSVRGGEHVYLRDLGDGNGRQPECGVTLEPTEPSTLQLIQDRDIKYPFGTTFENLDHFRDSIHEARDLALRSRDSHSHGTARSQRPPSRTQHPTYSRERH